MEVKRFKGIDYEFRPQSYWDISDPLEAILKNVKGTQRRQMIRDYWEAGRIEELFDTHLLDELGEEQRSRLGQIHPSFMGGEYLPHYEWGQIEIARVELQSTTSDVISIRASKEGERIAYSVVDEYETEFHVSPRSRAKPLSQAQLIDLIDNAGGGESLALCYTMMNSSGSCIEDLDAIRSFTRVESLFYPQLNLHYEQVLNFWYENEKAKLFGFAQ
jgi:hypothetical protein